MPHPATCVTATVLLLACSANADTYFWDIHKTGRNWSNPALWTGPDGVPDRPEDTAYVQGVTNYDPMCNLNFRIGTLYIRNGGNVYTGDGVDINNLLVVTAVEGGTGFTSITGSGSSLTVYRSSNHADFDTDDLTIGAGSVVEVRFDPDYQDGGRVQIDDFLRIREGARVDGAGSFEFTRADGDNDPVNDGHIKAMGGTLLFWGHADTVFDLDGPGENGQLEADDDSTLVIDVPVESEFNGTMNIEAGGEIQLTHPWTLASEDGALLEFSGGANDRRAVLSGETATILGTVRVNSGDAWLVAPASFGGGADVTVATNATLQVVTSGYIGPDAVFSGAGELIANQDAELVLDHDANIGVALRNDGDVLIAREQVTTVTLAGFEQGATGRSEYTLCGQDGGVSDALQVTGTATLDGHLDLVPDDDCPPQRGDEFQIILATGVVGEFSTVSGVEDAEIVYSETTVTVVVGGCLADLDDNDRVDFKDLCLILAAWGNEGGPEDLDNDGTVGFDDVLVVLSSWGPCA